MNPENKKIVLFDFDGVLANTLEFSYQIHKNINPDFSWEEFRKMSIGNFHEGYSKSLKNNKHIHPHDFFEKYNTNLGKINIHDALHLAVNELSKMYVLVVISSSSSKFIKDFFIKENIDQYFSDILGADIHTNKVIKIKKVLDKYNTKSKDAIFITDTLGDIKEATECGVPSIAVTWGLHPRETLIKGHPFAIIDNPQDLVSTIKNVLK